MLTGWGSGGVSCDTSHDSWKRRRQSASISRTLFYGKWWCLWSNVSVANLKSLHMAHMLKCYLESVEFWQEISSEGPWMCRLKTSVPAQAAPRPRSPKVIYNFYWQFTNEGRHSKTQFIHLSTNISIWKVSISEPRIEVTDCFWQLRSS